MSASPFEFDPQKARERAQELIAEHIAEIDDLSGVETVAMIRLPVSMGALAATLKCLREEHGEGIHATESNGWLRVWKK